MAEEDKVKVGIIGGSGFYEFLPEWEKEEISVETPYGVMEATRAVQGEKEAFFLPRHGKRHQYPPHLINYRANIYGLHLLKVRRIMAISAVGSMREEMQPGDFVLIAQFLDFTRQRLTSFSGEGQVLHLDVSDPYCAEIRGILLLALEAVGARYHAGGIYVCTEGPRYETPVEIQFFRSIGGDVVGMTGVPEVVLARELGMCYAGLCVVTNWAAGMIAQVLSAQEVEAIMSSRKATLWSILEYALPRISRLPTCTCTEVSHLARFSLP